MRDANPSKPMLARAAESVDAGTPPRAVELPAGKIKPATKQPAQLNMESARALVKRIRTKLAGRPQVEDSTEIIRKLRDA